MNTDLETIRAIGSEDKDAMTHLINIYIEQTDELIQSLETHVSNNDQIEIKSTAHALKGACLNLGFHSIGNICKELEENTNIDQTTALTQKAKTAYTILKNELSSLK